MTEFDRLPTESPLSQSVSREGKTVRIDIYENGDGGWLLEVVDGFGNSTVWDDSFSSDREALDEALKSIDEDGIDSLIGSPPDSDWEENLNLGLSDDELEELDEFLADDTLQETSMDVSTLEGYLTAIAIGPRLVMPSEWLPWIWDMEEGEASAPFENEEQASRIFSLIMRRYNSILQSFATAPEAFQPIFWRGNQWGVAEWCEGFILGFQFSDDAWSLLAAGQPEWFAPFLRFGTDDCIDTTKMTGDAEAWMSEIDASLGNLQRYWKENRHRRPGGTISEDSRLGSQNGVAQVVRNGPKISRNDACPCGSGKKYKKCCGAGDTSPTLH